MVLPISQISPKGDFVFTRGCLIFHWHCFQVSNTRAQLYQKNNLHSQGPLYAKSTRDDDRSMGPII